MVVVVDMMTADMVVVEAEAGVSHLVCDLSRFANSFLAFSLARFAPLDLTSFSSILFYHSSRPPFKGYGGGGRGGYDDRSGYGGKRYPESMH